MMNKTELEIKLIAPGDAQLKSMLQDHHADMMRHSPPENVHALKVENIDYSNITFWGSWQAETLAVCGALKHLSSQHGEIKSMRTAQAFLRQGLAKQLLMYIVNAAKEKGYSRISLETGSMDAFIPARKMYEEFGFVQCGPFADYKDDPHSYFMTLALYQSA